MLKYHINCKRKNSSVFISLSQKILSMGIIRFLFSKTFIKQIVLALLVLIVLVFLVMRWLDMTTNHGSYETVPDLKGKSVRLADIVLKDQNLVLQIQDSVNYNPKYPQYSVIDQDPVAGTKVKENRKIYVTLNPSGYRNIRVPESVIDQTYRQVKPALEAVGFKIGEISYVDNLGKDMVLELSHKGTAVMPGDKLPKTSVIDLVLGNGNRL